MPAYLYDRDERERPEDRPTPCPCCGVQVATRHGHGALRYPHACPHGQPCAAADPAIGRHLIDRGTCPDCNRARVADRLAGVSRRG